MRGEMLLQDFPKEYLNYIINPDDKVVQLLVEGIRKKNGHCPCEILQTPDTLCPCLKMRTEGICRCGLFVGIRREEQDD